MDPSSDGDRGRLTRRLSRASSLPVSGATVPFATPARLLWEIIVGSELRRSSAGGENCGGLALAALGLARMNPWPENEGETNGPAAPPLGECER